MQVDKETIWHFTCQSCTGHWSISASGRWKPRKLYCPHCGKQRTHDEELIQWVTENGRPD